MIPTFVVPFAYTTQYADESFADFALEVLGTDFKRANSGGNYY